MLNSARILFLGTAALISGSPDPASPVTQSLSRISDSPLLKQADGKYEALFEIRDDAIVSKHLRERAAGNLGLKCWKRTAALFPLSYRKLLIEFNVHAGERSASSFSGSGSNDLDRPGYRFSVARYALEQADRLGDADRPVTRRRGTLDWTLVNLIGSYICLRTNGIELFSREFFGEGLPQPERRKNPSGYPEDGSPRFDGDFVTSYAERATADRETVESFTTFLLVDELPDEDSLAARKMRFFETMPGYPELRKHVQSIGRRKR